MGRFCAPARRRYVEYEQFCSTVGEALTQPGLERAPLLEPVPHVPTLDSPLNFLNFEERNIVSGALKKLSKFPDQLSNILEVFEVSHLRNPIKINVSEDKIYKIFFIFWGFVWHAAVLPYNRQAI